MKTRIKALVLLMTILYACAILIDHKLVPTDWSNHLQAFVVVLFIIGIIFIFSISDKSYDISKYYDEPEEK